MLPLDRRPCDRGVSRAASAVATSGGFNFFPAPEADVIYATLTMPLGTAAAVTAAVAQCLDDSAEELRREVIERIGTDAVRHILIAVGNQPLGVAPGPLCAAFGCH